MKTISALLAIAALVALVVVEFSFVTAISILFAAGLLVVAAADYARVRRPLSVAASVAPTRLPRERLGLAA